MDEKLLKKRYLLEGETIDGMFKRVAECIRPSDSVEYVDLFRMGLFYPNSPTLANAGTTRGGLSACYVLPIVDSLDGIFRAASDLGAVHKMFGGTGFNLSPIRSKTEKIRTTGGDACGPVKVLKFLNQTADMVQQGGKREGANMAILDANHVDIDDWITCKDNDDNLTHFNISVGVTDEYAKDDDFLMKIAEHSFKTGDPGIIFLDNLNIHNPFKVRRLNATNPCGEQPLFDYESCNLGSINLSNCVDDGDIDWDKVLRLTEMGVRFLDSVIDKNRFPLEWIRKETLNNRKIGLGVMGWADMLIKMDILYASKDATDLAYKIGDYMYDTACETSGELAEELGTFPSIDETILSNRRNATLMTIAPTGSIHQFPGCSSGIEPNYAWDEERTTEESVVIKHHPLWDMIKGTEHEGMYANNIHWKWHVDHQASWQAGIDNAVSKTVNLPNNATVEDVFAIYKYAWKSGCKGVTIYRDGSKKKQVLRNVGVKRVTLDTRKRAGHTYERVSGCGTMYITANALQTNPCEVFVRTAGGCEANNEAIGRLISGWIQDGGSASDIARILHKVKCSTAIRRDGADGKSCADIIGGCMDEEFGGMDISNNVCPICGEVLKFGRGCAQGTCVRCGWSGCN